MRFSPLPRLIRFARCALVPCVVASVVACGESPRLTDHGSAPDGGTGIDGANGPSPGAGDAGDARDDGATRPEVEDREAALGYVEVPPMQDGAARARIFFSFVPADDRDANRPLLVVMNGGPAVATSAMLLPFGTGPATLVDGRGPVAVENAARWTRFAALLYVDSPETGFSYGVGPGAPAERCSQPAEAERHLLAVLDVLGKMPTGRTRRVIFVGAGYAGRRAILMRHLLATPDEASSDALKQAMAAHFAAAGGASGTSRRDLAVRQFGDVAFLQPTLVGQQRSIEQELIEADPILNGPSADPDRSEYDVRKTNAWASALVDQVAAAYADPPTRGRLLRGSLASLDGFGASARAAAVRVAPEAPFDVLVASVDKALAPTFGALRSGDYYWTPEAPSCVLNTSVLMANRWFEAAMRAGGRMFMTNARYDAFVHTPAIVKFLERADWAAVTVDREPRPGVARPGWVRVSPSGSAPMEIRFPTYDAGHMVTVSAAAELAEDLAAWVAEGADEREPRN